MAEFHDASQYRVIPAGKFKEMLLALADGARKAGKLPEFQQDLRLINQYLQTEPLALAGLKLPTGGSAFVECFGHFKKVTLHYLVYEQRKAVELLAINAVSPEQWP